MRLLAKIAIAKYINMWRLCASRSYPFHFVDIKVLSHVANARARKTEVGYAHDIAKLNRKMRYQRVTFSFLSPRPNTKVVAITRNGCLPLLTALPTWRTYHHNTPYSQRCVSFRYLRLCLTVESYPKVCVYAAATFLYAARVYSVVVLSSAPNISEFHVVRQYWYLLLSVTRSRRMPVPWVGVSQPGSVDLRPSRV